jgi:NADH/NAD ratio-sensing transcriptional regulator Rex
MNMSKNSAVIMFVVRDNGEIDFEASVKNFADNLSQYISEQENNFVEIDKAADKVGEKFDGVRLNKLAWISAIVRELNVDYSVIAVVQNRVSEYISTSNKFDVSRGKNGGVIYLKTQEERAAREIELQNEKVEKAQQAKEKNERKQAEKAALKAAGLK